MSSFDHELRYLEAAVEELETYLLSDKLYWTIGLSSSWGESVYPRLTLGNLMLFWKKATILAVSDSQKEALTRVSQQIDALHNKWRAAWGRKSSGEFRSRLDLWNTFLDEYRHDKTSNYDRYAYEVERRVILDLLRPDADDVGNAELELLESLDRYLKAVYRPGDFIWDEDLMAGFPKDNYWYLYGNLSA
jgi:hypothetical protein